MFKFILLHIFFQALFTKDCQMTAIVNFQMCQIVCAQKYGKDPETQKIFYNMKTEKCEKKVKCEGLHRIYYNRCVRMWEKKVIRKVLLPVPEIHLHIIEVVLHGNKYIKQLNKKCYPGFVSSQKRKKIEDQVYEEYLCDIPINENPYRYPQSHGQYYYHRLSSKMQVKTVDSVHGWANPFDLEGIFLIVVETVMLIGCFSVCCG